MSLSTYLKASPYGAAGAADRRFTPYAGLGGDGPAYDFRQPGAVREVKYALRLVAQAFSAPWETNLDPILETNWMNLQYDDVWDYPSAMEMALLGARFGDRFSASPPFVQTPAYPSGPQPTVAGLELLASVVNERVPTAPPLAIYEAWRGGLFRPPSAISQPSKDAAIIHTGLVWPVTLTPNDAPPKQMQDVRAADMSIAAGWTAAASSPDERSRALTVLEARAAWLAREQAIAAAGKSSPATIAQSKTCAPGTEWSAVDLACVAPPPPPIVPSPAPTPPSSGSAVWPWVVVAIATTAAGGYVYMKRRRPR